MKRLRGSRTVPGLGPKGLPHRRRPVLALTGGRETVPGPAGGERGAVVVWLALSLPVFLAALGFVTEAGRLFSGKAVLAGIADAAALAGVLELDLERLADGERHLVPERARRWAEEVALSNLDESFPGLARTVRVEVVNASPAAPAVHPVTGRRLVDPTVFVELRIRLPAVLPGGWTGVGLAARADASVLPRRY